MQKFIVAEITKNWTNETPVSDLLSQQFEMVINTNYERGYKLIEWKASSAYYNEVLTETIIAIFEIDNRESVPPYKEEDTGWLKNIKIGDKIKVLHEESESVTTVDKEDYELIQLYIKNPNAEEFARGFWFAPYKEEEDKVCGQNCGCTDSSQCKFPVKQK